MIGNDIIDIAYTKSTTDYRRKGYLEKIMNTSEQKVIRESSEPFFLTWRLWSMKEAGYKIHVNKTSNRVYNPTQLHCHIIDDIHGKVIIEGHKYFTHSKLNENYIFTQASESPPRDMQSKVLILDKVDYQHQRQSCYSALLSAIGEKRKINKKKLKVAKNSIGKPEVYFGLSKLDINVSLTHHGRYGAFSFGY